MRPLCWGVLALLACTPSEARKTEAARDTVRRFFAALPSRDCAVLAPTLVGPAAADCPKMLKDLNAHGLTLVEVVDATVDGRDPDAVLVRVRVARDGRGGEQTLLLRVERHPAGWKLRL